VSERRRERRVQEQRQLYLRPTCISFLFRRDVTATPDQKEEGGGRGGDRRVWNRPGWHSGPVLKASFPQLNPFSDPFIDPPPPLRQANARIFLSSGKVNYMRGWLLARARARACGEIAEREGRFSRKAGAREREIAGAILRDPPERLPISPW